MVTFRNDIHLGRRVPMTPKDEDQCMLVSISDEGLAVDKYGRKWQFVAFEERTVMPIIEIVDVTTDSTMGGYDPVNYPRIAGKKGGAYRITITEGEEDCTLWYKTLKYNEELDIFVEPSEWTQYTDPIVLTTGGRYCIKAYASQDGHKNSLEVQSDNFQVTPRLLKYNYTIEVQDGWFSYENIPANGGTVMPSLRYNIKAIGVGTDPSYQETQGRSDGATKSFTGGGADASTGAVTRNEPNNTTGNIFVGYVDVTLSYEIPEIDRYGVNPATEYIVKTTKRTGIDQSGKEKNTIYWDTIPASSITAGESVSFEAHAIEGEVTFEDGEGNAISSPLTNVQSDITIVAKVAATTNYASASSSKTVRVNAPALPYYWGMSNNNEYVPAQASPYSSGTTLISSLDDGGTFASGAVKDYSGVSVPIASIYFAVPTGKTVRIVGAGAGGDVTSDFTRNNNVGGYDIYYQTGYIQEKFTITVS